MTHPTAPPDTERTPSQARRRLAAPTVAMLPRIADSLSFLYLDIVRIQQDDTGVRAEVTSEQRGTETVYLPTAALSCVLLGPGTSITAPALATFARHAKTELTAVIKTNCHGVPGRTARAESTRQDTEPFPTCWM